MNKENNPARSKRIFILCLQRKIQKNSNDFLARNNRASDKDNSEIPSKFIGKSVADLKQWKTGIEHCISRQN